MSLVTLKAPPSQFAQDLPRAPRAPAPAARRPPSARAPHRAARTGRPPSAALLFVDASHARRLDHPAWNFSTRIFSRIALGMTGLTDPEPAADGTSRQRASRATRAGHSVARAGRRYA